MLVISEDSHSGKKKRRKSHSYFLRPRHGDLYTGCQELLEVIVVEKQAADAQKAQVEADSDRIAKEVTHILLLSVCLFYCQSVCFTVSQFVCLFVCSFVSLSVYLSM